MLIDELLILLQSKRLCHTDERGHGCDLCHPQSLFCQARKDKGTVKENKITSWFVEPTEGADLRAILHQLRSEPAIL